MPEVVVQTSKTLWQVAKLLAPKYGVWVETGTCVGGSAQAALDAGFKEVLSVEVMPKFHEEAKARFRDRPEVKLFLGKSTERLPQMIAAARGPCVCFLDAHPCGPGTGGHDDLMAKGLQSEFHQDNILRAEIETILRDGRAHVLLIDDQYNDQFVRVVQNLRPGYIAFYCSDNGDAKKVLGLMPKDQFAVLL